MTEQELRNKIAKHVCCACEMGLGDGECAERSDYRKCGVCGDVADALIAAKIGDVKDLQAQVDVLEITNIALQAGYDDAEKDRLYWVDKYKEAEHRAEVAERALGNLAYKIAVVKFGDMSTVAMEKVKNAALEQAEKELAEERKDD